MKNKYTVEDDVVTILINHKGDELKATVSLNKLDKVLSIPGSWCALQRKHTIYVQGVDANGKRVRLHRYITDAPADMQVDHRDHNGLNNTDSNLRVVTQEVNMQNLRESRTNNKSGVIGVYWNKQAQKWKAEVRANKRRHFLGLHDDLEDARKAVLEFRQNLRNEK